METITLDDLSNEYPPLKIIAWSDDQLLRILLVEQYSLDQALFHDLECRIHGVYVSPNVKSGVNVGQLDREYYFHNWNKYRDPKETNPYITFDRQRMISEDSVVYSA